MFGQLPCTDVAVASREADNDDAFAELFVYAPDVGHLDDSREAGERPEVGDDRAQQSHPLGTRANCELAPKLEYD